MAVKLTIPDLGDFDEVEVIEVVASPGDVVALEDPLITLETDKATMDVPAEQAGTIVSIDVKVGDRVSTGDPLVTIDATADEVPVENIEETRKNVGSGNRSGGTSDRTTDGCSNAFGTARRYRRRSGRLYGCISRSGSRAGCHSR